MKAVRPVFPERPELPSRMIAKDQDEYQSLPVVDLENEPGVCVARFELDEAEKAFIAENGYFYLYIWQGGRAMMPMRPAAEHPKFD